MLSKPAVSRGTLTVEQRSPIGGHLDTELCPKNCAILWVHPKNLGTNTDEHRAKP